jgi:NADP-dependent 3-hydroxy acid dehydrogenase YdfG
MAGRRSNQSVHWRRPDSAQPGRLIARGEDGLTAARREVEAAGGRALVLPVDVANANAVEAAADYVEKTLGPIDI